MRRIGPRKLLRSIIMAQDPTTPGPAMTQASHSVGSMPSTPLTFDKFNSHSQDLQVNDGYFPRDSEILRAPRSDSGSDPERQGPESQWTPRRPQMRPQISRRITTAVAGSRTLASPSPVDAALSVVVTTPPESTDQNVVDGSTVLLVEGTKTNVQHRTLRHLLTTAPSLQTTTST